MDGMLARMPERLRVEWGAFFELEPWGCQAEDLRAAYLAPVVGFFGGPKPQELFASFKEEEREQTLEEAVAIARRMAGA